jgi:2-O-methyltransferase
MTGMAEPRSQQAAPARSRYAFWSMFTAAQARRSGRSRAEIDDLVVSFFHRVCEIVSPTVTLEIGAHAAEFSRWARASFPDARCLALEANPYVYARHHDGLLEADIDYRHLAAAIEPGTVTLNIPTEVRGIARKRTTAMASLAHHAESTAGEESVEVAAVRIDDLVDLGPEDRVVAWVDVEGATSMVLPGGTDTLTRASAVFVEVERETTWDGQWLDTDVAEFLEGLGKTPVLRDIQRPHQYNVVFADLELAARPEIARLAARTHLPGEAHDARVTAEGDERTS